MHPLLIPGKGNLLEPSDPNPYEAPKNSIDISGRRYPRPNTFDWIFAIVLGVLALAAVFPTTCTGSAYLLLFFIDLTGLPFALAPAFFVTAIVATLLFSIASAFWVGKLYINAVVKAQANKDEEIAEAYQENESCSGLRHDSCRSIRLCYFVRQEFWRIPLQQKQ